MNAFTPRDHEPGDEILDLILSRVDGELADALARRRRPSLSDDQLDAILDAADADLLRVVRRHTASLDIPIATLDTVAAVEGAIERCETRRYDP